MSIIRSKGLKVRTTTLIANLVATNDSSLSKTYLLQAIREPVSRIQAEKMCHCHAFELSGS